MSIPEHDWIQSYLELTENTEPPLLYREWIACSTIASVLQRKYRLTWGTLTFYPNMFVVLVGPPGRCKKGVAMGMAHSMLRDIGIRTTAEAVTREALIRDLSESASTIEDPTTGRQLVHSSLTIFSKELAVFLGYDNKSLMSDLTDWYDCDDKWTYRTKGSGTDEIVGVWVNLIGATTPDLVQTQLPQDAVGGGLASRIIFVFEEQKGKSVAAPFLSEEQEQLREDLKEDLERLYGLAGEVKYTEGFIEEYVKWYNNDGVRSDFTRGPLSYYNERRANHVMRLCVVLSASQQETALTPQILHRAINLLKRTEVKMPQTFGGYGSGEKSGTLHKIMEIVAKKGETTREHILEELQFELDDTKQLDGLLGVMKAMGFCRVKHTEKDTYLVYNEEKDMGKHFRVNSTEIE